MHNDLEKDPVRPFDGDNDRNVLSAFTDDDLLENDIALAMASAPQSTVTSFDRIHAQVEKDGIGQQKKHASGSDVDQSDVEPATDYQFQAECGSSTSDLQVIAMIK
eukprot:scaffold425_cov155-Chaetoceros_neogracile.AAC.3